MVVHCITGECQARQAIAKKTGKNSKIPMRKAEEEEEEQQMDGKEKQDSPTRS